VTIAETHQRRHNKGDHYFVTLLQSDGTRVPEAELDTGYDTWATLTPFTPVTATFWHGALVEVSTQNPPALRTVEAPDYGADANRRHAVYSWFGAIVMLAVYLMSRKLSRRSRRSTFGGGGTVATSPAGFQFEHGDDP
jgi:hypothetical protein